MMVGRIRSIKPSIHTDEELWDAETQSGFPLFRIFTGLWNYSDREGRFEWRPLVLRGLILPFWTGDFEAALLALTPHFVERYEVDGRAYGRVCTLKRHNRFSPREPQSKLPPPPADCVPPVAANDNGKPARRRVSKRPKSPENGASNGTAGGVPPGEPGADTQRGHSTAAAVTEHCLSSAASAPQHTQDALGSGIWDLGSGNGDLGSGKTTRGRACAPARASPSPSPRPPPSSSPSPAEMFDSSDVVRVFSERRKAAGGGSYQLKHTDYQRAQAAVQWALAEQPEAPELAVTMSITRFLNFARGKEADDGWPFWGWANDPGRWFAMTAPMGSPMGRVGTDEEFADGAKKNPAWLEGES